VADGKARLSRHRERGAQSAKQLLRAADISGSSGEAARHRPRLILRARDRHGHLVNPCAVTCHFSLRAGTPFISVTNRKQECYHLGTALATIKLVRGCPYGLSTKPSSLSKRNAEEELPS